VHSEGELMTGLIIERPKYFSAEIKITYKCTFSNDWQQNFKDCHGIRELNIGGEVLSPDDEAAEQYSELFYNLVEHHKLFPSQIYSADETRLLWQCLPYSISTGASEKHVKGLYIKTEKQFLYVLMKMEAVS
jgi:hypothetical protein